MVPVMGIVNKVWVHETVGEDRRVGSLYQYWGFFSLFPGFNGAVWWCKLAWFLSLLPVAGVFISISSWRDFPILNSLYEEILIYLNCL